ncbi:NADP-dependent oxidoreductase [Arcanobacterium haemolyticum]|nr:NADP-dependent oxidoreductase [Arcanobacterium haemolyticum]
MKAYALDSYTDGGHLTWIDAPQPHATPGTVLVKVQAAGINPLDRMIAAGTFKVLLRYKLPQILGNEFAGVIEEVGAGVTGYRVGDAVYARPNIATMGGFGEYVVVDAADIAPMPSNLSFPEAASLPLVLLTAIQAMTEKVQVKPGDKVFIQGGAGGLGSIAIQVAKHLGATVATTVGTKDVELARELGADIVVDYKTQKYEDFVSEFDLVLDTLGRDELFRSMKVLRRGGHMVSVVGAPDTNFARQLGMPYLAPVLWWQSRKVRQAAKEQGVSYDFLFMRANGKQLAEFTPAVESGAIRPLVGHIFDFDSIEDALALSASGKSNPGKIVVSMEG